MYLGEPVDEERFAAVDRAGFLPEESRPGDRVLYLYTPDGPGRSKPAEVLNRPALFKGVTVTTRNWNTVTRLAELTGGQGVIRG